jgi:hypothetical protein
MKREFESFVFCISSGSDARTAFVKWMEKTNEHEEIITLFGLKTEQLEHIEATMDESDRSSLTTIEAGSFFTATYVLKFDRRLLESRKFQVCFSANYLNPGDSSPQSNSTATNVLISPYPIVLSIVAIIAALLGTLLRASLGDQTSPLHEISGLTKSGKLLVGPVLALIFFNVYEYTSLGKSIRMAVSWRSALLIGALCGLAQENVLAALKALIGS